MTGTITIQTLLLEETPDGDLTGVKDPRLVPTAVIDHDAWAEALGALFGCDPDTWALEPDEIHIPRLDARRFDIQISWALDHYGHMPISRLSMKERNLMRMCKVAEPLVKRALADGLKIGYRVYDTAA